MDVDLSLSSFSKYRHGQGCDMTRAGIRPSGQVVNGVCRTFDRYPLIYIKYMTKIVKKSFVSFLVWGKKKKETHTHRYLSIIKSISFFYLLLVLLFPYI